MGMAGRVRVFGTAIEGPYRRNIFTTEAGRALRKDTEAGLPLI
jgi:hypothetical protein